MFDMTVDESREFELIPDDKWVLARLVRRDVIRWDEESHKYVDSTDDILKKILISLNKARSAEDESRIQELVQDVKAYQFSFVFSPLEDKKWANYSVRGRTGTWIAFEKKDGTHSPNKLAQFYLGAGGKTAKKGEKINIDSVIGNYVAIKLSNNKGKSNGRVYQQVTSVRELTTDELARAKSVEVEIRKIEEAVKAAAHAVSDRDQEVEGASITQKPVMETELGSADSSGEVPF